MPYKQPRILPVSNEKMASLESRHYRPFIHTESIFQESFINQIFFTDVDYSYSPDTFSFRTFFNDMKERSESLHSRSVSIHSVFIERFLKYGDFFRIDDAFRFLYEVFNDAHVRVKERPMTIIDLVHHYNTFIIGYDLKGRPLYHLPKMYYRFPTTELTASTLPLVTHYLLCYPEPGEEHNMYTMEIREEHLRVSLPETVNFVEDQYFEVYRFHDLESDGDIMKQQFLSMFIKWEHDHFDYQFMIRSQTLYEVGKMPVFEYVTRSGAVKQSDDEKWHNFRITAPIHMRESFRSQHRYGHEHIIPSNDVFTHPIVRYTGLLEKMKHVRLRGSQAGYHALVQDEQGNLKENYYLPLSSEYRYICKADHTAHSLINAIKAMTPNYNRRINFTAEQILPEHLLPRLNGNTADILHFSEQEEKVFTAQYYHSVPTDLKSDMDDVIAFYNRYILASKIGPIMLRRFTQMPSVHISMISRYGSNTRILSNMAINGNPSSYLLQYMKYHHRNPAIEQLMKDDMFIDFANGFFERDNPLPNPQATTSHGAFNLSRAFIRAIRQVDDITSEYHKIYQQNPQNNGGNPNRRVNSGGLFTYASSSIDYLRLFNDYFTYNEKPSPRFFQSIRDFYEAAIDSGNRDTSLVTALRSCTHEFLDEEGTTHHLALHLGSYVNYMRHALQYQALSLRQFNTEFNDYLSMKVNIHKSTDFDYYPRPSLRLAHDVALRDFNLIKQEVQRESFKRRVTSYSEMLSFKPKKSPLIFVAPKTPEEVIDEGRNLRHCVGSYVSRISDGKSYIMFLRLEEKPEESMYTIEVGKDFSIVQTQGHSGDYGAEIKEAIRQYRKYLNENAGSFSMNKKFSSVLV